MNSLARNDDTGFIDSGYSFTSNRKLEILKLAKEYVQTFREFPLIHELCKTVGIDVRTFERHLKQDSAFKYEWDEILAILRSVYTNKLAIKANSANGIVANLAILKYLETGSFVDRLQVNSVDTMSAHKRVNDAIIIDVDPEIPNNQPNSAP